MKNRETSPSDLPPIDTSEDVQSYQAHSESKEVKFEPNNFEAAQVVGSTIVLPSGAGYQGPRLEELLRAMKQYGKNAKRVL